MSVIFPPYSGGGGGGGVATVNGDPGPDVVLDAVDVGALDAADIAFTTVARRLYGTGSSGEPSTYVVSQSDTSLSVAQRGVGGVLVVGTPSAVNHATTKAYVDQAITDAVANAVMSDGTVTDIVARTQAEYDALTPDPTTHYLIDG